MVNQSIERTKSFTSLMYVDHIFLKKQDWQITYLKLKKCSFQWSEHLLRLIQDLAMKGVLITHLLFHFFFGFIRCTSMLQIWWKSLILHNLVSKKSIADDESESDDENNWCCWWYVLVMWWNFPKAFSLLCTHSLTSCEG